MKKRKRTSVALLAAALVVMLLAGAGIAASQLGVFHMLDTAEPIVPLEGAENLVGTNLGYVENDLVRLTVEEAVFDGQGAMLQVRIAPKDPQKYVLYNSMLQDASEDLFEIERRPVEVGSCGQVLETDAGTLEIINDQQKGRRELLLNGEAVAIPTDRETALEQGLVVYEQGDKLYYADLEEYEVTGSKDGREILDYWPRFEAETDPADAEALGLDNLLNSMDAQGQADGSVIVWTSGFSEEPMDLEELKVRCSASVTLANGEKSTTDEVEVVLPRQEKMRTVSIEPVGDGSGERFRILSGSIDFTKVRAYFNLDYEYHQAETGEDMGITFRMYDADGQQITLGGGWGSLGDENGVFHTRMEMQSFDQIPETIYLEAKVVGEDVTLGRVECRLVEK